ncbi:MAG TPA: tetratricopeptide repeat protein [Chthoniobacterales bacterium]|nr:tetratricopeptide repeat protein [Chthoniobacterales bacterium]
MPIASQTSDVAIETRVFWLRFQKEIAAALIIVILSMSGYAGYRFYKHRRDSAAAELLGKAKAQQDFQEVIVRYPGTAAGASAYLLLAQKQREEKKFADANATLRAFIDKSPDHDFVPTARLAMAANLESMGKNDEALAIYKEVATKYTDTYNGPLALISQVPLLKAQNRIEDARRVCEEILTKYRMPRQQAEATRDERMGTIWAGEAMRQLRLLKPPEKPKPTPAGNAPGAPPMIAVPPAAAPSAPPQPSASASAPKKPR